MFTIKRYAATLVKAGELGGYLIPQGFSGLPFEKLEVNFKRTSAKS